MATSTGNLDLAVDPNPSCASINQPCNSSKNKTEKEENINFSSSKALDASAVPKTQQANIGSWADQVENFSQKSSGGNNENSNKTNTRFYIIKRQEGTFSEISPFFIHKMLHSLVGEIKCVKKLRSGDLFIEVQNSTQAQNIEKLTNFGNIPVHVSPHRTLNSSRGVISEQDLLFVTESEILENLRDQNIINVSRINIRKDNKIIPTKHIILTFDTPNLPQSIKAGYLNCPVRPYIPNPLWCFQCQRFGHSKASCRGAITCARCSSPGHESDNCTAPARCVNCGKDHPSYFKSCEKWKTEKEIQTIRTKQKISYPEAKKIVLSLSPTVGISYSAAASKATNHNSKTYQTVATQTDTMPQYTINEKNLTDKARSVHKAPSKATTSEDKEIKNPSPKTKLPPSKFIVQKINEKESLARKSSTNRHISNKPNKRTALPSTAKSGKKKINTAKNSSQAFSRNNAQMEDPALTLYVSDLSSGEEDNMSTSSGPRDNITDIII